MKKYIFLTIVTILLSCCHHNSVQKEVRSDRSMPSEDLVFELNAYNQQVPKKTSPTVTQEKATFNYDDRMFEYNYTEIMPDGASIEYARVNLEYMRLNILEDRLKNDYLGYDRLFLNLLVKDNYGIRVRYVFKPNNDTIQVDVSPQEIDSLLNKIHYNE